jgi:putative redox protein
LVSVATIKWLEKERFIGTSISGHTVPFDSDREANTAPGPMEMLLLALGACSATDVVTILKKKRQPLEALEITVSGERKADPPRVWTKIEVVYRLRGKLEEKAVRDAVQLSETKYCSVAAMLSKTAQISTRIEIERT